MTKYIVNVTSRERERERERERDSIWYTNRSIIKLFITKTVQAAIQIVLSKYYLKAPLKSQRISAT